MSQALDTFPRLLLHHAQVRGARPAFREKYLGIWQSYTWAEVAENVKALACGLAAQGFKRGDHLAIIGDNRPHLYWAFTAAEALGGIPVPMYQDAVAAEMQHVLADAEINFAIVEDQEQVDKLIEAREANPKFLKHIIFNDPRGLRNYNQAGLMGYEDLQALGRKYSETHRSFFEDEITKGHTDDVAIMLYTSGTTGKPKGVCQTHAAMIMSGRGGAAFDKLTDQDTVLSYLPMAWVGDFLFSHAQAYVTGFTVNCPESAETVMTDLREIGPTYYFAPPRVFESLLTSLTIRMEDAGAIKRKLYGHFMNLAKRVGSDILDKKPVSIADTLQYRIGELCVYGPLKNTLGMSRIRVAYTAGAAIGPDLFRFYRSIGINLKQLYGTTETCAYVCLQPDGEIKFDSVGKPAPGVEVKIADNGEVLTRGANVLKEYYKRPDATAEVIDAQGYYHTGDAGVFDSDGHLKIIDRAKDVGRLSGGAMFAPNYIENKLKFFPHIKEAVAFGHDRTEVCAFINIDLTAVGNWAERRNLVYSGYVDLASKPEVLTLIQECVEKVNAELASEGELSHSQIARFLVLHKELDPDDDELTRTRKVRRGFIQEKYGPLVDALFTGKSEQFIETQVKFEDGRTGTVSATIPVRDAKTFPAVQKAA
jgi:long-chain acyl-CoA synthetase